MKKKILIIGGTGFIGSNLVKKLILYDYDLFSIFLLYKSDAADDSIGV